jgi:hypothetical protein
MAAAGASLRVTLYPDREQGTPNRYMVSEVNPRSFHGNGFFDPFKAL